MGIPSGYSILRYVQVCTSCIYSGYRDSMTEGLRERKKRETRAGLHRAALEITHAEGTGAATVERIAEQAGVSTRTFFNYFASKDDAISGVDPALPEQLAAELLARPAEEPLVDALRAVMLGRLEAATADPELWALRRQVARDNPGFSAATVSSNLDVIDALADAAYQRAGSDPRSDAAPAALTFAVLSAIRAAFWVHARRGFRGDVAAVLDEVWQQGR